MDPLGVITTSSREGTFCERVPMVPFGDMMTSSLGGGTARAPTGVVMVGGFVEMSRFLYSRVGGPFDAKSGLGPVVAKAGTPWLYMDVPEDCQFCTGIGSECSCTPCSFQAQIANLLSSLLCRPVLVRGSRSRDAHAHRRRRLIRYMLVGHPHGFCCRRSWKVHWFIVRGTRLVVRCSWGTGRDRHELCPWRQLRGDRMLASVRIRIPLYTLRWTSMLI